MHSAPDVMLYGLFCEINKCILFINITSLLIIRRKKGHFLIHHSPCLVIQVQEPILLLGKERFEGVDIRVRVKGGGHVSRIYGKNQKKRKRKKWVKVHLHRLCSLCNLCIKCFVPFFSNPLATSPVAMQIFSFLGK